MSGLVVTDYFSALTFAAAVMRRAPVTAVSLASAASSCVSLAAHSGMGKRVSVRPNAATLSLSPRNDGSPVATQTSLRELCISVSVLGKE